jgi:protoheme IX farnesyltransferase
MTDTVTDILPMSRALPIGGGARICAYVELTRPRIAALVLVATAVGYFFAIPPGGNGAMGPLCTTLLGTLLLAAGSNALNQFLEAEHDGRMIRTMDRPIPSGRLCKHEVLAFGLLTGLGGIVILAVMVNGLCGALGAAALATYVLLYTPLKRKSWRSVLVGAVPGALPPVIGWAGATGSLSTPVWLLFAIVYLWQLPHFAAIAWLHREDYAAAGYPMLPVIDRSGVRTFRHLLFSTVLLVATTLLAAPLGMAGIAYTIGAAALGLAFFVCGLVLTVRRTSAAARLHLLGSIVYLPLLLGLLMLDRVP